MVTKIKLVGAPGVGKTTTLQRLTLWMNGYTTDGKEDLKEALLKLGFEEDFLEEIHNKYELNNIIYVTFQNSSLEEFVERRFNMSLNMRQAGGEIRYFRTLHGLCLTLLHDFGILKKSYSTVSPTTHFKKFAKEYRLIDPSFLFDDDSMGISNYYYKGNILWQTMTRVINTKYHTLKNKNMIHQHIIAELPADLIPAYEEWLKYKKKNNIIDYNDMLTMAYDALKERKIKLDRPFTVVSGKDVYEYHLKVLILDEAQDLSPLQWEIIREIAKDMDYFIFAGDDWQSIFGWSGAEARIFTNEPANTTIILTETFRLPILINKIGKTYAYYYLKKDIFKPLKPMKQEIGRFVIINFNRKKKSDKLYLARIIAGDLAKGKSVMLLTRTNNLAIGFMSFFLLHGIVPRMLKRNTRWMREVSPIGNFFDLMTSLIRVEEARLKNKKPKPEDVARALWAMDLLDETEFKELISNPSLVKYITPNWRDKINTNKIQYHWGNGAKYTVISFIRRGFKRITGLPEDYTLFIDTIHSSKGSEADCVYILNEMPKKEILNDEQERKVWFVGITRAREKVVILQTDRGYPKLNQLIAVIKNKSPLDQIFNLTKLT